MTTTNPKEVKLPKTLAACADRLWAIKSAKAAAQSVVDNLDTERKAIEDHLIRTLPKDDATGILGKAAKVKLLVNDVPQVEDWDKVHAYVARYKAWHLLQRRVSSAAVAELWDDGKKIPGIVPFTVVSISLTKVS